MRQTWIALSREDREKLRAFDALAKVGKDTNGRTLTPIEAQTIRLRVQILRRLSADPALSGLNLAGQTSSRTAIYRFVRDYAERGIDALIPRKRGRKALVSRQKRIIGILKQLHGQFPRAAPPELTSKLNEQTGLSLSLARVRYYLGLAGIRFRQKRQSN